MRNNMSLVLKQDFEHTDIYFLHDLYRKIKILVKSINKNQTTTSKVLDTISSTINLSKLKRICLSKTIVNKKLSPENLYCSDYGLMSEEDKLKYLDLINFCLKNVFKFAYHIQDYISASHEKELFENLPDDDDDDGPVIYSSNTWLPLYSNIIEKLPVEIQNTIKEIYSKENEKYGNMCKGKKSSSRKQNFTIIKKEIEELLNAENIDKNIIQDLISDLKYCNSTKQSCDEKRYLWQKATSKELIVDAINNLLLTRYYRKINV